MPHAMQGAAEDSGHFAESKSHDHAENNRSQKTACARRGQPVKVEFRIFWSGLRHYGLAAQHTAMQIREIPATRPKGRRRRFAHGSLDRRQSPKQDEPRENRERKPGLRNLSRCVALALASPL